MELTSSKQSLICKCIKILFTVQANLVFNLWLTLTALVLMHVLHSYCRCPNITDEMANNSTKILVTRLCVIHGVTGNSMENFAKPDES